MPDHPLRSSVPLLLLRLAPLFAAAFASGCVPVIKGVGLRDAVVAAPEAFPEQAADEAPLSPGSLFDDPHLAALVDEALANNQELAILQQELVAANAEILAARGEAFPRLGLGVDVGLEKVGRYTSQGAADASSEMRPGMEVPEHLGDFGVSLLASWEIDVWGKFRNATKAARRRALASAEARNLGVTVLVGELADTYYELLALDSQLTVVDSNIELLEQAVQIVRLQREAARVTELAVQRFEAELLRSRSHRWVIAQAIVEAENRINQLVGRYPQPVARSAAPFLQTPLASVEPGAPSQLLQRRPDVKAAELQLEAAALDVKVARARFFPALGMDVSFGIEAFSPKELINLPASILYSVAGNLMAPLLNRTGLTAAYTTANARQMQAVLGYEQTALRAFVEVANKLALVGNLDRSFELKQQQVGRLEQAVDTSNRLFAAARADYLEVLTTRREALEARMELVETKHAQLAARVELYRALGGGWPPGDSTPAPEAPNPTSPSGGTP